MKKKIFAVILTIIVAVASCGLIAGCGNDLKNELLTVFEDSFFGNFSSGKVDGGISASVKTTGSDWSNYNAFAIENFTGKAQIKDEKFWIESSFKQTRYNNEAHTEYDVREFKSVIADKAAYMDDSGKGVYDYREIEYYNLPFILPVRFVLTGNISELLRGCGVMKDVNAAETTLGGAVRAFDGIFKNAGASLDLNKFIGQDATASTDGDGYTLTLMKGDYTSKITKLRDDIVNSFNKPFKDAFKKFFGTDISKAFDGLKRKFKADSKVSEVLDFIAGGMTDSGLTAASISNIFESLFRELGYFKGSDYKAYTIDSFISELTGGSYNYATGVKYVEDLLNGTLANFINVVTRDSDFTENTLEPAMKSGAMPKADFDFVVKFDGEKKITKVSISYDMHMTYSYGGAQEVKSKAGFTVTDFGNVAVNVPTNVNY